MPAPIERARGTHGAKILIEPTNFEYSERQYTAEDPAGHQCTFSETLADPEGNRFCVVDITS